MMNRHGRFMGLCLCAVLAGKVGAAANDLLSVTGLVISVSFSDTHPEYIHPLKDIDDFFNDPGYADNPANVATNSGSLFSWFHEVSNGRFSLYHEVVHFNAPRPAEYYLHKSVSAKRVKELLDEAILHLREQDRFDFSRLTLNTEGEVVALGMFYVSNAQPREDDFIPGYAGASKKDYGTFKTKRFHIVPQRNFFQLPDGRRPLVLRTFAHEAAHAVLDWPDLYDIDSSSKGLGMASLMSGTGDYNNPLLPLAYLRGKESWIQVVDITDDPPGTTHEATGDGEIAFRYNHPTNPDEYFLIDAAHKASRPDGRFSTSKNPGVPPEGLRIWHVDEKGVNSREVMTPTSHYKVSMVQADGRFDLEKNANPGDSGDTFHRGHVTEFNDATVPNARWWDGAESGLGIKDIGPIGPVIRFTTNHRRKPVFVDNALPFMVRQTHGYVNFPSNRYRLTNITQSKHLDWKAQTSARWLSLSATSGRLAPGETVELIATIDEAAAKAPDRHASANVAIAVPGEKIVVRRSIGLAIEPPRLVHHWTFDETKGDIFADRYAAGGADIQLNKRFLARNSIEGCAERGVNVGSRGELVADLKGWTTGTITLSAWAKVPKAGNGRPQMLMQFPNENAGLQFDREGTLRYTWGKGQGGAAKLEIEPGAWNFVALSINHSNAMVYVVQADGEVQSRAFPKRRHKPLDLTYFYIGGTSHKNNLEGSVDDVRIYNYPLNGNELRKLAETGAVPMK